MTWVRVRPYIEHAWGYKSGFRRCTTCQYWLRPDIRPDETRCPECHYPYRCRSRH
jgi:uncharacterized paraquat-inducible protein A